MEDDDVSASILRQAGAAVDSGLLQSNVRFKEKQLHGLHAMITSEKQKLLKACQDHGMEDIDVEREISILVRDIDTHLRNLKDLRKPWTGPWGITSRQAYGLGLAMLLVSPSTPNPMRGVLGAMAAAFSAGNVVVIAVISGQESITSFMKHNSRRYLHPDALFIMEGQNPDLAGKNFDRTLTFEVHQPLDPIRHSTSRLIVCDRTSQLNVVVLDENFSESSNMDQTLIAPLCRHFVDPSELIHAIFVPRADLSVFEAACERGGVGALKTKSISSPGMLKRDVTSIERRFAATGSASRVTVPYDSLEQLIDLFRKDGNNVNIFSLLGFSNTETTKYLQDFIPHRICGLHSLPGAIPFCSFGEIPWL